MSTVMTNTTVSVVIYNWSCLKQGHKLVLNPRGDTLTLDHESARATPWILIPNLADGATQGGYTIFNSALGVTPEQPAVGNPIPIVTLSKDPYGSKLHCWTLRALGGTPQGERLWSIHDHRQSAAMDNRGACDPGLDVHLMNFTAQDNQKWVLRRVN